MFKESLIDDLVCPVGKEKLAVSDGYLVCSKCGVRYPVIDNIPHLLIDDAVFPEGVSKISELECMKK